VTAGAMRCGAVRVLSTSACWSRMLGLREKPVRGYVRVHFVCKSLFLCAYVCM
jgi:hypothetical protein